MRAKKRQEEFAGLTYVGPLGAGATGEVALYQQHLPLRLVAVKLMRPDSAQARDREVFYREAATMARVSHHPAIVTIFDAGVTGAGRPYLVMEYCPGATLAERITRGELTPADVIDSGIRLAGALHTAHTVGILHLDIKPSNVLTTQLGSPALADFGLAVVWQAQGEVTARGASMAWAAPEALRGGAVSPATDLYSLAATLYTALAGRAPRESEQQNTVMGPAQREPRMARIAPLGIVGLPAGLEPLLRAALSDDPAERPGSALEMADSLLDVQQAAGLPPTPVDTAQDNARAHDVAGVSPQIIDPTPMQAVTPARTLAALTTQREARESAAQQLRQSTVQISRPPAVPTACGTSPAPVAAAVCAPAGPRARWRALALAAAGVGAAAVVAVAIALAGNAGQASPRDGAGAPDPGALEVQRDQVQVADPVPVVQRVTGERQADGSVRFTWENPVPLEGDRYQWSLLGAPDQQRAARHVALDADMTIEAAGVADLDQGPVCVEVVLVRADGRLSPEPARGCAS